MPRKYFDTSGKSAALFHHHAICKTPMAVPYKGLFGAIAGKNPYPQLKLHRLATANDRLRVAEPRALPMRVPEEIST
jgi:hypothetical protein